MAAKAIGPFHLLYGEEDFLQDRFLNERTWKGRQVIRRNGNSSLTGRDIVNLCESKSFFDEAGKVVIVDNAQAVKDDGALARYLTETNSSTILIAVIRGAKIPAQWTDFAKRGKTEFASFKPWETAKVVDFVKDEAKALGVSLEAGVAEGIQHNVGFNLRRITNELVKLSYLAGPKGTVTKEHVRKVLLSTIEVGPRDVVEAALSKNKMRALRHLSRLFRSSGDGACIPVVTSFLYQVEKILLARQMLDQGCSSKEIADRLGVHEYSLKMNLLPLAQKHTVPALLGHMNRLCKLDSQIKGAARSKRTLVELAVLAISTS